MIYWYVLCLLGYDKTYKDDKHFGKNSYSIGRSVEQIQTEIMTNGPVEAAFTVYSDFPSYKSGMKIQRKFFAQKMLLQYNTSAFNVVCVQLLDIMRSCFICLCVHLYRGV